MLRNSLPLSRIIGIAFIGLSVFLFSVLAYEMIEARNNEYIPNTFSTRDMLMLASSSAALFMGIGMILRLNWARMLLVLLVMGFGAFLAYEVFSTTNYNSLNAIIGIGAFVCVFTLSLCFGLLMYNEKLNKEFDDESERNMYDDTIDLDLMKLE